MQLVSFRCSRFEVPEDKVSWDVDFPDYDPIEFFAVQPVPIPEDPDYRFVSFKIKIVSWVHLLAHRYRKYKQNYFSKIKH